MFFELHLKGLNKGGDDFKSKSHLFFILVLKQRDWIWSFYVEKGFRILHTSDWAFGEHLKDKDRTDEFESLTGFWKL